jgi:hypothetical protein
MFGELVRAKSKGGADEVDKVVVVVELTEVEEAPVVVVDVEIEGLKDVWIVLDDLDVLDGAVVLCAKDPKLIVG